MLVPENVLSKQRLCFMSEKVFFVPENVLVDLDGIVSSMNIVSIL